MSQLTHLRLSLYSDILLPRHLFTRISAFSSLFLCLTVAYFSPFNISLSPSCLVLLLSSLSLLFISLSCYFLLFFSVTACQWRLVFLRCLTSSVWHKYVIMNVCLYHTHTAALYQPHTHTSKWLSCFYIKKRQWKKTAVLFLVHLLLLSSSPPLDAGGLLTNCHWWARGDSVGRNERSGLLKKHKRTQKSDRKEKRSDSVQGNYRMSPCFRLHFTHHILVREAALHSSHSTARLSEHTLRFHP